MNDEVVVRRLGCVEYEPVWRAMQRLTLERGPESADEIWCLQHPPVYTLGLNGDPAHRLHASEIPMLHVDRGGQITYHGPGQVVVYPLLDLRRSGLGVRALVSALENAVIELLGGMDIEAAARRDAPGVYVGGAKIASVGLRVRRGGSYHGLAFNVDLDLAPFQHINPCGMQGLPVTRLADLRAGTTAHDVAEPLLRCLLRQLGRRGRTASRDSFAQTSAEAP